MLDFFALGEWRGEGPRPPIGLVQLLFQFDFNTIQGALAGLSQAIVAVPGIAITVVSIIVQLAATRYSPRIAELARVSAKDFWKVTDRGINFDYIDTSRKEKLAEFFAWFKES